MKRGIGLEAASPKWQTRATEELARWQNRGLQHGASGFRSPQPPPTAGDSATSSNACRGWNGRCVAVSDDGDRIASDTPSHIAELRSISHRPLSRGQYRSLQTSIHIHDEQSLHDLPSSEMNDYGLPMTGSLPVTTSLPMLHSLSHGHAGGDVDGRSMSPGHPPSDQGMYATAGRNTRNKTRSTPTLSLSSRQRSLNNGGAGHIVVDAQ